MSQQVRVRFAPSPTGPLHIGGLRTALFNYLFAKKHGGVFILRIEDTDRSRFVEGAEDYISEALNWSGIPFDEGPGKDGGYGPYRQSERSHLYQKYAEQLINSGRAYFAFDSAEELERHRKDHEAQGKTFIYNWHNREKGRLANSLVMSQEEVNERITSGEPYVVRFKSPRDRILKFTDLVRGEIKIDTNVLDDKVLFKSDGMPTYHLANIVDDHLMGISHVIRGEEWLPSLALHFLLYEAFDWSPPKFAHLPLILKPVGKGKLSKRDGEKLGFPVFPLEWKDPKTGTISSGYREDGYFPETVVNFLSLLGWSPEDEQEIFSLEELIEAFDLDRVHKSGARFDPEKTRWFNHHYLQTKLDLELAVQFKNMRPELSSVDVNYVALVVGLIKERASFVREFWDLSSYFFQAPTEYNPKALKKAFNEDTSDILQEITNIVTRTQAYNAHNLQTEIKSWITDRQIGFGKVMMPLRLALVGDLKGPDVFDIMFMIGKNECVKRIDTLIQKSQD
jgi:glutamyl-tRNA synthetase